MSIYDCGDFVEIKEIPLPSVEEWNDLRDISLYVYECLLALKLVGWSFGWDRAVRRLGSCNFTRSRITLSRYFAEANMKKNPELIRRTILHELAHVLAMEYHGESGHGTMWYVYCLRLGLEEPTVRSKCEDFTPAHFKCRTTRYVLCHCETGEIFRRYKSRPRKTADRLKHTYIIGRKEETLGKLVVRAVTEGEALQPPDNQA